MTKHEMFLQGSLDRLLGLSELDGKLDYSVESVKLIDGVIDKYFENGEPIVSGFFAERTEYRITALGTYVGEVIIRNTNGCQFDGFRTGYPALHTGSRRRKYLPVRFQ